jgi:hypothetical protein
VIGSGLEFAARGAHELKGVPGEWNLFAVTSAGPGYSEGLQMSDDRRQARIGYVDPSEEG